MAEQQVNNFNNYGYLDVQIESKWAELQHYISADQYNKLKRDIIRTAAARGINLSKHLYTGSDPNGTVNIDTVCPDVVAGQEVSVKDLVKLRSLTKNLVLYTTGVEDDPDNPGEKRLKIVNGKPDSTYDFLNESLISKPLAALYNEVRQVVVDMKNGAPCVECSTSCRTGCGQTCYNSCFIQCGSDNCKNACMGTSACSNSCLTTCHNETCASECEATCGNGACKQRCSAACGKDACGVNACTITCGQTCSGTCVNDCTSSCGFSSCTTSCKGSSKGVTACSTSSCGNSCYNQNCGNSCSGSCSNECSASCSGGCTNTCVQTCSGTCVNSCTSSCVSDCTTSCKGSSKGVTACSTADSASCGNNCYGQTCGNSCSGSCNALCTIGCEVNQCKSNGCSGGGGCHTNCTDSCGGSSCMGSYSCFGTCHHNVCSGYCLEFSSCANECIFYCKGGCETNCGSGCSINNCGGGCSGEIGELNVEKKNSPFKWGVLLLLKLIQVYPYSQSIERISTELVPSMFPFSSTSTKRHPALGSTRASSGECRRPCTSVHHSRSSTESESLCLKAALQNDSGAFLSAPSIVFSILSMRTLIERNLSSSAFVSSYSESLRFLNFIILPRINMIFYLKVTPIIFF